MLNFKIDRLILSIEDAGGQEHRIRPIAVRAAALFAESLDEYCAETPGLSGSGNLANLSAAAVDVDLSTTTDEHAAQSIARAWLDALALRLR